MLAKSVTLGECGAASPISEAIAKDIAFQLEKSFSLAKAPNAGIQLCIFLMGTGAQRGAFPYWCAKHFMDRALLPTMWWPIGTGTKIITPKAISAGQLCVKIIAIRYDKASQIVVNDPPWQN